MFVSPDIGNRACTLEIEVGSSNPLCPSYRHYRCHTTVELKRLDGTLVKKAQNPRPHSPQGVNAIASCVAYSKAAAAFFTNSSPSRM
jgi:hypothetical protein